MTDRFSKTLLAVGASTDKIKELLTVSGVFPDVSVAVSDNSGVISVTVSVEEKNCIDQVDTAIKDIRKILGQNILGESGDTVERRVVSLLKRRHCELATAESCTSGMISSMITEIEGASSVFEFGISAYSNEIKTKALNVSPVLLERFGAVSSQTAAQMAIGAMRVSGADIGLSVTGVAGPATSEGKPVGLVYVGMCDAYGLWVLKLSLTDKGYDRDEIRRRTSVYALDLVRRYLEFPDFGADLYRGNDDYCITIERLFDFSVDRAYIDTLSKHRQAAEKADTGTNKVSGGVRPGDAESPFERDPEDGVRNGKHTGILTDDEIKAKMFSSAAPKRMNTIDNAAADEAGDILRRMFPEDIGTERRSESVGTPSLSDTSSPSDDAHHSDDAHSSDEAHPSDEACPSDNIGSADISSSVDTPFFAEAPLSADTPPSSDTTPSSDTVSVGTGADASADAHTDTNTDTNTDADTGAHTSTDTDIGADNKSSVQDTDSGDDMTATDDSVPHDGGSTVSEKDPSNENAYPTKTEKGKARRFLSTVLPWVGDSVPIMIGKIALIVVCLLSVALCAYVISDFAAVGRQRELTKELNSAYREASLPDDADTVNENGIYKKFGDLYASNPDIRGWIGSSGGALSGPVMSGDNNYFYSTHDFYGKTSRYGSIFCDAALGIVDGNSSGNTVLYGSSFDDSAPFSGLKEYRSAEYLSEHPLIYLDSLTESGSYVIFAVIETNADNYRDYASDTGSDITGYISRLREASLFDVSIETENAKQLLTLVTQSGDNGRLIVVARRLSDSESIPSVDVTVRRG